MKQAHLARREITRSHANYLRPEERPRHHLCLGKRYHRAAIHDTTIKLKRCLAACHLKPEAKQDYLAASWDKMEACAVRTRTHAEIRRIEEEMHMASLKAHRPELHLAQLDYDGKRKRSLKMVEKARQLALASRLSETSGKQHQVENRVGTAEVDILDNSSDQLQPSVATRRQKSMLWRLHRRDPTLRPSLQAL